MNAPISLRNCYGWNCPECGYKNVIEQFINELQPPDANGIGMFEAGPKHSGAVFCERCEEEFPVEPPPPLSEFEDFQS